MNGLAVAGAYGFVSVCITLFNKAVFAYYHFNFPLTLFVTQMSITLLALVVANKVRAIELPRLTSQLAFKIAPLAIAWWIYGVSGVIAMKYLNVPMFSALRRVTTLAVMVGEFLVFRKRHPIPNVLAVLMMVTAAGAAGLTDTTLNVRGVAWVMVCAFSTAAYLLLISKIGQETQLDNFGMLLANNSVAYPLMLVSWVISGELGDIPGYEFIQSPSFWAFFILTASQACLLNYLIFLCTRVNSPLTTSITGTIKDLFTNILGLFLFGDVDFNAPNIISIILCMLASMWYSYLQYQQKVNNAQLSDSNKKEQELPVLKHEYEQTSGQDPDEGDLQSDSE